MRRCWRRWGECSLEMYMAAIKRWRPEMTRLDLRRTQTATGKQGLVLTGECEWDDFPIHAQRVVEHFGMVVIEKMDGLNERMWITRIGESRFCVSWDIWVPEVSIMAWENTPDSEVDRLMLKAAP